MGWKDLFWIIVPLASIVAAIVYAVTATRWVQRVRALHLETAEQVFTLQSTAHMFSALLYCDDSTLASILEPHLPVDKEGRAFGGIHPVTGELVWQTPSRVASDVAFRVVVTTKKSSSPSGDGWDRPVEAAWPLRHQHESKTETTE